MKFTLTKLHRDIGSAARITFLDSHKEIPAIDLEFDWSKDVDKEYATGIRELVDVLIKTLYGQNALDTTDPETLEEEIFIMECFIHHRLLEMEVGEQKCFIAGKEDCDDISLTLEWDEVPDEQDVVLPEKQSDNQNKEDGLDAHETTSDTIRFLAKSTGGFFRQINILFLDERSQWDMKTLLYTSEPPKIEREWSGHRGLYERLNKGFFGVGTWDEKNFKEFESVILGWANNAKAFDEAIFVAKKVDKRIELQLENSTSHDTMSKDMKLLESEPMKFNLTRRFDNGGPAAEVEFLGKLADEPRERLVKLRCGDWVFISRIYKVFVEKHLKKDIPPDELDELFDGFAQWIIGHVENMEYGECRTLALSVNSDGSVCYTSNISTQPKEKCEEETNEIVWLLVDGNKFKNVKNVRVVEESRMVYFEQHSPAKTRICSWLSFNSLTIHHVEP